MRVFVSACAVALLCFPNSTTGADAPKSYAYLFSGNGEFLKLQMAPVQVAAQWSLQRVPGLLGELPQAQWWRISNWLINSKGDVLYGTFQPDEFDEDRWRVLALSLPDFEVVGRVGPLSTMNAPELLLTEQEQTLSLHLRAEGDPAAKKSDYDVETGTLKRSVPQSEGWLTSDSVVGSQIYARYRVGRLAPDGTVTWSPLEAKYLVGDRERIAWHELGGAADLAPTRVSLVSVAASRGIVALSEPNGPRKLLVVDLVSKKAVSPLVDGPRGELRLSGDGNAILASEIAPATIVEYTGRLWRYDLATHTATSVAVPQFVGSWEDNRWLCASRDGKVVLIATRRNWEWGFDAVSLEGGGSVTRIPSTFSPHELPDCVVGTQ